MIPGKAEAGPSAQEIEKAVRDSVEEILNSHK
jgi:hypothetical protein